MVVGHTLRLSKAQHLVFLGCTITLLGENEFG